MLGRGFWINGIHVPFLIKEADLGDTNFEFFINLQNARKLKKI